MSRLPEGAGSSPLGQDSVIASKTPLRFGLASGSAELCSKEPIRPANGAINPSLLKPRAHAADAAAKGGRVGLDEDEVFGAPSQVPSRADVGVLALAVAVVFASAATAEARDDALGMGIVAAFGSVVPRG